jgi:extradiol dioxygenase family protein
MTEAAIHQAQFQIAFPVKNLEATKLFYKDVLGCDIVHAGSDNVEFSFYGHSLKARLFSSAKGMDQMVTVKGKKEPLYHFGLVLDRQTWLQLLNKLEAAGIDFIMPPKVYNKGKKDEHGGLFIEDPSGNFLAFNYHSNNT